MRDKLLTLTEAALEDIRKYAAWGETHARLHDDAYAAMCNAGVSRLYLPSSLGGYEVDPVTCALVCETLAKADSVAAWHVMVLNAAKLMAAYWPSETVESLWQDNADVLVAANGHTPFLVSYLTNLNKLVR